MSSPIPGFEPVEPLQEPKYHQLKIVNTDDTATAIRQALGLALARQLIDYGAAEGRRDPSTGQVALTVKLTDSNGTDYFADEGDYVVLTFHGDDLCGITLYNGPDGRYTTNLKFSDFFPQQPQ